MRREWFTADFCRPVYEIWLAEAVARGRISAPGFFMDPIIRAAYLGSDWVGPSQGQLDPEKEINAEILAIEHGFSTHEQSTIKLNGGQWSANVKQLTVENQQLQEAGLDSSQKSGPEEMLTAGIKALIQKTVKEEISHDTEQTPPASAGRT
jgi:capsid protein